MNRPHVFTIPFFIYLAVVLPVDAVEPDLPVGILEFTDAFDSASSRRPKPGEWLEYLVAFPVDPLENHLSPNPAPLAPADSRGEKLNPRYLTSFNLPQAWRVLPLRLVIRRVDTDFCQAVMTFAGETHNATLPFFRERPASVFRYPVPQPANQKRLHQLNGRPIEVEMSSRRGAGYGFVRLSSPEVPFGLVRFATENLDLILIGLGDSPEPEFPLPDAESIEPPPGMLYGMTNGKEAN
ncbi:MAG: hypothetical protein FWG74_01185 [Planctomycetes bacterium]|nr:hypothetical protein [Planctomycetota bacterium]